MDPGGRIPALDGVRGLAILGVVLFHYEARVGSPWPVITPLWERAHSLGWLGVDVFLVLSGFLITSILLETRGAERYFGPFYARRTLRIFPLYYTALLLTLIILPAFGTAGAVPLKTQAWYWAYASNILIAWKDWGASTNFTPHFWSLALEEQFYLIWPAVVLHLRNRNLMLVCAAIACASAVSRTALVLYNVPMHFTLIAPSSRVEGLAAGALLATAFRLPHTLARVARLGLPMFLVTTSAMLGLLWARGTGRMNDPWMASVGVTLIAWWTVSLIIMCTTDRPAHALAQRSMSHPSLRFFGRYSYGIYVWHYPILVGLAQAGLTMVAMQGAVGHPGVGNALYVLVAGTLTVVVSLASWRLLESRFLRLKQQFPYPSAQASPAPGRRAVGTT